jgi:hypothetical protein
MKEKTLLYAFLVITIFVCIPFVESLLRVVNCVSRDRFVVYHQPLRSGDKGIGKEIGCDKPQRRENGRRPGGNLDSAALTRSPAARPLLFPDLDPMAEAV